MSSTNDDWFIIKDFDSFVNATRALVFNNFGKYHNEEEIDLLTFNVHPDDIEEIDNILSFDESKIIVNTFIKKQKHKLTKQTRYILNDHLYVEVVSALNDRMVSNLLNSLVNKGLVESAYDTESNDFVFWIKDEKNIEEIPETD
jgi:hypothetical protein